MRLSQRDTILEAQEALVVLGVLGAPGDLRDPLAQQGPVVQEDLVRAPEILLALGERLERLWATA